MKSNRRKKYVVDSGLQFSLARRLLVYWCATWLIVFALPICTRLFFTSLPFDQLASKLLADLWFPMLMSVMLLPIVAWESLRFSNKIAGPVHRVRRTLQNLAEQQPVAPIRLRKGDFCHELAQDVNRVISRYSVPDKPSKVDDQEQNEVAVTTLQ